MADRVVRIGIDVGGTHTKAVALDNSTHEIIGKSSVKTTHFSKYGVAEGVVTAFKNCLSENNISPEDVIFIAHSTTQATNALLEGDVAPVGILGMSKGGLEAFLAKRQTNIKDIDLVTGRKIKTYNRFVKLPASDDELRAAVKSLLNDGAKVIVASKAFGVDGAEEEERVTDIALNEHVESTKASDITKMYGLTIRTQTAAINASILPKMIATAESTEQSVKEAGITVPLMMMRGDGGVMEIAEMKRRPVLTMLSGPAASIMGALMYLRASNGVYFEVGGTSTNIGVIKNGRPAVNYSIVGKHRTYISSLDARVLGVAGGSMVRANKNGIFDVGPRSAHIANLPYAAFTPTEELVNLKVEQFAPKDGDPADYIRVRSETGTVVAITNTCAANVLGYAKPGDFSYGNVQSATLAMQALADWLGKSLEETAEDILRISCEKIEKVIDVLSEEYKLEKEQTLLVGCGGGAAALLPFTAKKMGLKYTIPENAEVISSIGVALAMVRDVVERVIPEPTQEDIASIKREAIEMAISSGAVADSVEVHIEIDTQKQRVTAIATGYTEARTTDLQKQCDEAEARELVKATLPDPNKEIVLEKKNEHFFVFSCMSDSKERNIRVIDKKGFIRVQRQDGTVTSTTVRDSLDELKKLWDACSYFKNDTQMNPDIYVIKGAKMVDLTGLLKFEHAKSIFSTEITDCDPEEELIFVGAKNIIS